MPITMIRTLTPPALGSAGPLWTAHGRCQRTRSIVGAASTGTTMTDMRYCYICTYVNCGKWGGQELFEALTERLAGSQVRVKAYLCFGACAMGPNVVLQPE